MRGYFTSRRGSALSMWAAAAAFTAYFCMYAFRKPFAAAAFEGDPIVDLPPKLAFVLAQLVGYTLSKFIGIKIVSEVPRARRAWTLALLVGFAEGALVVFALLPTEGRIAAMFLNGLPLGMIWGLVFAFIEGRRTTELLGAALSTSYIVASGAVKSAGAAWMQVGVSESWMPAVTGLCFAPVFAAALFILHHLPAPDAADEAARTARGPMSATDRRAFLRAFAPGLVLLTAVYTLLTGFRDLRDNFAAELWQELGHGDAPALFTLTEIPAALLALIAVAALTRVRNNHRAVGWIFAILLTGTLAMTAATLAWRAEVIDEVLWMVIVGAGLYLAYVPYGCALFDRWIAAGGTPGTAVFMIYVTDAFGYLGSLGIVLWRNFGEPDLAWAAFFSRFALATGVICSVAFVAAYADFRRRRP